MFLYQILSLAALAVAVWLLLRILYPPKKPHLCCLCGRGFAPDDIVVKLDLRALPTGEDFGPVHWKCAAALPKEAGTPSITFKIGKGNDAHRKM